MRHLSIFFIAILIALSLHFSTNLISDPDALYHMRHADLLRTNGIFDTPFPWAQFSSIHTFGADLWYGFHLLLIPFTLISDPLLSIKIAGFIFTALALAIYYLAFRQTRVAFPSMWAIMLFISSSQFLLRASMLRPHVLTSALSIFFLPAFFFMPPWVVGTISFLISFMHSTVFWVPLIVLGAAILACFITKQKRDWRKVFFALSGILLGLLLRPNALDLLPLLRTQLIDIQFAKFGGIPLSIGNELKPFDLQALAQQYAPLAILFITFFALLYRIQKPKTRIQESPLLVSSGMLTFIFLCLTFFVARRFIDISNAFLFLTASILATPALSLLLKIKRQNLITIFVLSCLVFLPYTGFLLYRESRAGIDPLYMKEPALWLKENTKPGEIIFHAHWDDFPKLFFWNTHNYYINGMDPVFLYTFDSSLYFKQLYYAIDEATAYTCGADRCKRDEVISTHDVLKKDFRSSYIFLDEQKNPKLIPYFITTSGYEHVYHDAQFHIFKITSLAP
ncbi:MAG: hypothetical protein AAB367_00050 [Patescibacteria group bacterium]